jgi:large subunit ribosomal protein L29
MKFKEIKDLPKDELERKLKTTQQEVFELKMKNVLGQVPNPMRIRHAKREIARLTTAIANK